MSNGIVHFEIPANQPEDADEVLQPPFGWKFQKAPQPGPEYWMCEPTTEPGINGAVAKRQNAGQPWMNYVDVANIDASLAQATQLGGKVALPKTQIAEVSAIAAILDPEGNICGLWQKTW